MYHFSVDPMVFFTALQLAPYGERAMDTECGEGRRGEQLGKNELWGGYDVKVMKVSTQYGVGSFPLSSVQFGVQWDSFEGLVVSYSAYLSIIVPYPTSLSQLFFLFSFSSSFHSTLTPHT